MILGANWPWCKYGRDFTGHMNWAEVEQIYPVLRDIGVSWVRWWIYGDCSAAPQFDWWGNVQYLQQQVLDNFKRLLELTFEHGLCIMPVILDYKALDKRTAIVCRKFERSAFIEKAVKPLVAATGGDMRVTWDIINEPEWQVRGNGYTDGRVTSKQTQTFVQQVAAAIHKAQDNLLHAQKVTVGSANYSWLSHYTELGLDNYQVHAWDWMEEEAEMKLVPRDQLPIPADEAVVTVGEFPCGFGDKTATEWLDKLRDYGYEYCALWAANYPESKGAVDEVRRWMEVNG